jgi:hypothetical protein
MKWKARTSWAIRWGGLAAAVVIASSLVYSTWWYALLVGKGTPSPLHGLIVGNGRIVYRYINLERVPFFSHVKWETSFGPRDVPGWRWWPEWVWRRTGSIDLVVPLWMPLLVVSIPSGLAWCGWFRARRRARIGSCPACGYDLSGNRGAVCPECGSTQGPNL